MLHDLAAAAGYPDECFLVEAVRHFLLPLLPGTIAIEEFPGSAHNPIRVAEGTKLAELRGISIDVSCEILLVFIAAVGSRRAAAAAQAKRARAADAGPIIAMVRSVRPEIRETFATMDEALAWGEDQLRLGRSVELIPPGYEPPRPAPPAPTFKTRADYLD